MDKWFFVYLIDRVLETPSEYIYSRFLFYGCGRYMSR